MKKKLLFVFIFVLITCCGWSGKYTLTYVKDNFSEEFVLEDVTGIEDEILVRYTEDSEYLVIDENNSYTYTLKDGKRYYSYKMGKDFIITPLIDSCFEDIFVVDEKDYINIKTSGENQCEGKIEFYFKTDKVVVSSNASSVKNNTYKWDSLDDGINLHFSKVDKVSLDKDISSEKKEVLIRLGICAGVIVLFVGVVIFLKKNFDE